MSRSRKSIGSSMIETLEGRRLLSGNVTVTSSGPGLEGLITITGDNKSNQISVHRIGGAGTNYIVEGQNGTTVNGAPSLVVDSSGAFRNINISLGNGEDELTLTGSGFNSVNVDMGNGSDIVSVHDTLFFNFSAASHGNLNIDTGNGGDDVSISNTAVNGNLDVDLGNGPDSLTFGGVNAVGGTSTLNGGHGPNSLFGTAPVGSVINDF